MTAGSGIKTKIVFATVIMLCALIGSCSTMSKAEREAKRAERAKYVAKVMDDRHYTIDIDMMYPRRIGGQSVRSDWSLEVRGDTLVSYLPYVGVAHEATLGNSTGLNFTAPIKSYTDSGFKNGKRTIRMRANSDEDQFEYHLEVTDDGSTFIDVLPQKREGISYSGQIPEEL